MGKFSRKLRIGEKIGFGFGAVGLLFLGVIWQYHTTLQQALNDYRQLHDIYEVRETRAQAIENSMLQAQHAEKRFALTRDEAFAEEVLMNLEQALGAAAEMGTVDKQVAPVAEELIDLINDYGQRFRDVVSAWRLKGLDHNSGLQGAFRNSVHELEDMAANLKVDRLYLLLLQIRRGEKDLGLRREEQYRERVLSLIQDFSTEVSASGLDDGLKARLFHEIAIYRDTFEQYAETVLGDPQPHAGKGPFRQAAHRIEDLLEAHHVSGLGEKILQVRRREKDYLLRHDKKYVDMALGELDQITAQVKTSAIADEDRTRFTFLLDNYRQDFRALVQQNDRITRLNKEMLAAVSKIVALVEVNVKIADQAVVSTRKSVDEVTARNEQVMLWVVVLATLLGIFLAFTITVSIVGPLLRMAGLLDQLASEEPAERVPFFSGGRDEVNAMAGSVNAMADHKARFIDWWKATMREADACGRLQELVKNQGGSAQLTEAKAELRQSVGARRELLQEQYQNMHQLIDRILERTETLLQDARPGATEVALNTVRYSARTVQTLLLMASAPEIWKRGAHQG
jgi:HAMP domain-containing protein/CHASE3 domain sensor protein